ncbi:sulfotransferase domain-containing protein [Candidatus Pacearchaeota archaeon]|nr:sulfotransferase domain-containing protein [Candidatus Pacearchaeota archaeon]
MKILIAGFAKTGTTGLFFKIRNSIGGEVRELFEVRNYQPMPDDNKKLVLAKVLIGAQNFEWDYKNYSFFDKKILIIRDPRDRFISYLLYKIMHSKFWNDEEKVSRFVDLLRKKEENPDSVSVLEIVKLFYELDGWYFDNAVFKNETTNQTNFMIDFLEEYQNFFILKYEDFIDGNLKKLEEYLGFELTGSSEVRKHFQRVVRTKSYDNWKNWFTKEDVEYFKPLFIVFMNHFGYAENWNLNENKIIHPEHCSKYLERIIKERFEINKREKEGSLWNNSK